jgi:hypothetical protein
VLKRVEAEPVPLDALKGRTGILAATSERNTRRVAEVNMFALSSAISRDIFRCVRPSQ